MNFDQRVFFDSIKLKTIMLQKRIQQVDISQKMNVSQQHISNVMTKGSCQMKTLITICKILDIDVNEIIEN